MFGLSPDMIILLTVGAGFSQAIVLSLTLFVFYKNLKVLKKHNELIIKRFTFQSNVDKYTLTLKFADWVKSELTDWLPYALGTIKHEFMSKDEIKEHFDNISLNMIKLINDDIVFKSLMYDEIKKMVSSLEIIDKEDVFIAHLNSMLKST